MKQLVKLDNPGYQQLWKREERRHHKTSIRWFPGKSGLVGLAWVNVNFNAGKFGLLGIQELLALLGLLVLLGSLRLLELLELLELSELIK